MYSLALILDCQTKAGHIWSASSYSLASTSYYVLNESWFHEWLLISHTIPVYAHVPLSFYFFLCRIVIILIFSVIWPWAIFPWYYNAFRSSPLLIFTVSTAFTALPVLNWPRSLYWRSSRSFSWRDLGGGLGFYL